MQTKLFFKEIEFTRKFPSTRYLGSKNKFIDWIWHHLKNLEFTSVLDAFGGTGSVSYKLKQENKIVTYNDILKFNSIIGKALIENSQETLDDNEIVWLQQEHHNNYNNFIETIFNEIYFTDDENRWLDIVIQNIPLLNNSYKESIAWFALFQSCIIKRPYNLFHRKNLYIRTSEVERSFGNKKTWDTPFHIHFTKFAKEANNAVFSNSQNNISLNENSIDIKKRFDLVYIDTPYISGKGVGVNYHSFYHFLEGMTDYKNWINRIDNKSKHKKLQSINSEWENAQQIEQSFERIISGFKDSILVISYRSDGIPTVEKITEMLEENGKKVKIFKSTNIKYALSSKVLSEVLIIGQ